MAFSDFGNVSRPTAKTFAILAIAFAAFLFLSGCTTVPNKDKFDYGPNVSMNATMYLNDISNYTAIPGQWPCTCMYCTNRTLSGVASIWNSIKGAFGGGDLETTLAYGNCSFEMCNVTEMQGLMVAATPKRFSRFFMVGQGPNPAEYAGAQRYCNGSLNMPVIWASGNSSSVPKVLQRQMATCYLERGQMPVVVFYNNDPDPSKHIPLISWTNAALAYNQNDTSKGFVAGGTSLDADGPIGPVVITTEAFFNSSDPVTLARVGQELTEVRNNCPNCLTALAVPDLDMKAVNYFLNQSTTTGATYYDKIDMVGIGFIANDDTNETSCEYSDPQTEVMRRYIFSKDILGKYNKPTVWYAFGISNGTTRLNCSWDAVQVRNAYQWVFSSADEFVQAGIVGVAPYKMYDRQDTLPMACNETNHTCDFGFKDLIDAQKDQSFYGWFSDCQYYFTNYKYGSQISSPGSMQTPIIFSTNGKSMECTISNSAKMGRVAETLVGNQPPTQIIREPTAIDEDHIATLTCGTCLSVAPMPSVLCYGHIDDQSPFNKPAYCTNYSQIDEAASNAKVDPLLMRAIILGESAFKPCTISESSTTNPEGCRAKDYTHTSGVKKTCDMLSKSPSYACTSTDLSRTCSGLSVGTEPCGLGLTQELEGPGQDNDYTDNCGGTEYNPFDPYENTCAGANKFYEYYTARLKEVQSHLKGPTDAFTAMVGNNKEWYAAWLALTDYNVGIGKNRVSIDDMIYYADHIQNTQQDYYNSVFGYMDNVVLRGKGGQYYATKALRRYNDAINLCGGGCQYYACYDPQGGSTSSSNPTPGN